MKTKNSLKTMLILTACMIIHFTWVNAQEKPIDIDQFAIHAYSDDFVLFKHLDDIDIYYRYADCGDPANGFYPEYLLFKLVNRSDQSQRVTWWWKLHYNGKLATDDYISDEDKVEVILKPAEILQADCRQKELSIFVQTYNNVSYSVLTDYSLHNLVVEPIR